jgi:hypothetical protein
MCHGFIDPRFLMRETEDHLRDMPRVPAPEAAPRPAWVPGLVAALRRLVGAPQPKHAPVAAE